MKYSIGSNRLNSSGQFPATPGKSSQRIANVIPAGQTVPLPVAGNFFYVTAATAAFDIKPSGGVFQSFSVGTGLNLLPQNSFNQIQVRNTTGNSIAFEMFVGFDGFIDNRVIISDAGGKQVAYPTYPTANAATSVAINDLSGGSFTDINGNKWYALSRVTIIISNVDAGVTLLLQKSGSVVSGGPAIAAIYPVTALRYDASGNYALNTGGGNINAIVSEIYNAVAST